MFIVVILLAALVLLTATDGGGILNTEDTERTEEEIPCNRQSRLIKQDMATISAARTR